jgi:predicted nucleic acid-binding protein
LDVNVWLALAAGAHTHHDRAKDYWEKEAASSFRSLSTINSQLSTIFESVVGGQRAADRVPFQDRSGPF